MSCIVFRNYTHIDLQGIIQCFSTRLISRFHDPIASNVINKKESGVHSLKNHAFKIISNLNSQSIETIYILKGTNKQT